MDDETKLKKKLAARQRKAVAASKKRPWPKPTVEELRSDVLPPGTRTEAMLRLRALNQIISNLKLDLKKARAMAETRESQLKDDLKRAIDSNTWSREYDRELKARHEAERVALAQRDYARTEIARVESKAAEYVARAEADVAALTEERDAYRQTLVYLHRLAVTGAVRHPQADVLFSVVADEAVGILMECRAAKTPKKEKTDGQDLRSRGHIRIRLRLRRFRESSRCAGRDRRLAPRVGLAHSTPAPAGRTARRSAGVWRRCCVVLGVRAASRV